MRVGARGLSWNRALQPWVIALLARLPTPPPPLIPSPPSTYTSQGESDAYSYLSAKSRLSLREDDARQLMRDVLSALAYMHDRVSNGWV